MLWKSIGAKRPEVWEEGNALARTTHSSTRVMPTSRHRMFSSRLVRTDALTPYADALFVQKQENGERDRCPVGACPLSAFGVYAWVRHCSGTLQRQAIVHCLLFRGENIWLQKFDGDADMLTCICCDERA